MLVRRLISRMVYTLLMSLAVAAGSLSHATAQTPGADPQSLLLGTGATEETYHPVGVALSTLVKLKLLPDLEIDLTAVNTDGSYDNVDLMREGGIQLGILSALVGHEAKRGIGRFAEVGADRDLRAITTLWSNTDHVIVQNGAVQSGTIDDLLAMRGQKLALGSDLSSSLLENRALMAPLGLDIDTDFERAGLDFEGSTDAFVSGEIAGMSLTGALPLSAVQALFDEAGDSATFLEFNDEQLALIDQGRRVWSRAVIPAGTYAQQSRDIFTIGSPNILVARADVDDDVVYQITKTIFENLDYLHSLHETTGQISLDTAVNTLPLPIHEGALRYFQEKGVELPTPPVEVNPDLFARFDSTREAREALNQGTVTIFAGADGKTSSRVASELASTLNGVNYDFRLLPTFGGGSAQNLTDLLYVQGVDSALVQTDVVAYAEEQNIYPGVTGKISYLTEMFPEEVHLVAGEGIKDITDLRDQKVDVGVPGSGTDITASIILSQLDLPVETTGFGGYDALDKLTRGEISAAFFVGGKPLPLLKQIDDNSGLHLLSIPFVQFADSYRSASISHLDYPALIDPVSADEVQTLAVRTALVTYQWKPGTSRYQAIANFGNAFFDRLRDLHQDGRHPKWREVDPTSEIEGWTRFPSATEWLGNNALAAERIALEGQYLVEEALLGSVTGEPGELLQPEPSLSLDAALSPGEASLQEPAAGVDEEPAILQDERPVADVESDSEASGPAGGPAEILPVIVPSAEAQPLAPATAAENLIERLDDKGREVIPSLPSTSINPVPNASRPTF